MFAHKTNTMESKEKRERTICCSRTSWTTIGLRLQSKESRAATRPLIWLDWTPIRYWMLSRSHAAAGISDSENTEFLEPTAALTTSGVTTSQRQAHSS